MKTEHLLFLCFCLATFYAHGQDGDIERRCASLKETVVKNRIEWITQKEIYYHSDSRRDCEDAERKYRFRFDSLGNLVQYVEFWSTGTKIVKYKRNALGAYTAKEYWFHEKNGHLHSHHTWELTLTATTINLRRELFFAASALKYVCYRFPDSSSSRRRSYSVRLFIP